jgi:hypothetical protein
MEKKIGAALLRAFLLLNHLEHRSMHQHDTYISTGTKILTYEDVQEKQSALGWASDEEEVDGEEASRAVEVNLGDLEAEAGKRMGSTRRPVYDTRIRHL